MKKNKKTQNKYNKKWSNGRKQRNNNTMMGGMTVNDNS